MPGMKNMLSRAAVKFAGIQAMEHATETVTGVGQQRIEREVGMRTDAQPESLFDEAAKVAKEQAAQVVLLTPVLGGGAAIGSEAYALAGASGAGPGAVGGAPVKGTRPRASRSPARRAGSAASRWSTSSCTARPVWAKLRSPTSSLLK